ncbi:hypothetical protein [Crossiella cryophila]|uniref:Uncharacterized protein n=1 Tax=Crossiella cryophila TaxID=43355 RepID=A0A7W7CDD1_9PSEU|nr:hypothetical protein [Crossiella cryophila]MBB4679049.1 hypothetical protein [Crossiella cryophila]
MSDLLDFVLEKHGGLTAWQNTTEITAHLNAGGPFWGLRGYPDAFTSQTLVVDPHRQHHVITPWLDPGHNLTFQPEEVTLRDNTGALVDRLAEPRGTYRGYDALTPWQPLQVGYFLGYAMWNYLVTPYLFTFDGVRAEEGEPWQENGETWRRLHVTFPADLATHTAEQTFHYGPDGLLRRLDYTVDVNADVLVAHYTGEHRTVGGLVFPTSRRVYRRNPDNTADLSLAGITLELNDITVA